MKKFLRRLGKTRFMILMLIIFGVISFCYNGWLGLIAAAIGWWLGSVIYYWKEYKQRLKNFLRRRTKFQLNVMVKSIILLPIAVMSFYYYGRLGLVGVFVGWIVGEFICRRFLNLK